MVNSTVNGKKIGKPAGQNDNAKITACEIIQKARNELQEEWTLDAKGILHKRVMESLNKKMNLDDKESSKVALIENLQRRDLTPIEEARTYQKILELEDGMTQEQLARNE